MSIGAQFNALTTGRREEIFDYPPIAIREAIVNAVTHRLCVA
jgi:predicted HTH transcriptional regulator